MKIYIFIIFIIFNSCTQNIISQGKMEWISKYDLYENIYGKGIESKRGLNVTKFLILDESIIFIAAEKDSYFFDTKEDNAILFISKDLGNEYKEIIFPEESIVSIHSYGKKSLIETNIGGYGNNAKNCIYLLDNTSLKYKKIREFSPNSISQIKFNGNFISYNENGDVILIDILNNVNYKIPNIVTKGNYILEDKDANIIFLDKNKIIRYNVIEEKFTTIRNLTKTYSTITDVFGEINLGVIDLVTGTVYIYDLTERELFKFSPKDEKYKYRYKNFVCDYKRKEYYPTIRFSYDYGKTWKEYNTSDFTIESSIYGFYKDKYIIFEAAFMEKGAYIMIGEIMK